MSEKLKGIFGSETRADEVLKWLKNQGADAIPNIENFKDSEVIFYVNKDKKIKKLHITCAELFDIVELPRWRAKYEEHYYYVSDWGVVRKSKDQCWGEDNERYECGNYFKTKEEAEKYAEKIREIFREIKSK